MSKWQGLGYYTICNLICTVTVLLIETGYMKLLTQRQRPFLFMAQQAVWDSCYHGFLLFSNPGGAMQKGVVKYCTLCSITVSWEMLIWEMHLFLWSKPSPCSGRNITSIFKFLIANITLRSGPNKGWSWPCILDIHVGTHLGAWEILIAGVQYPMSSPQFLQQFFLAQTYGHMR